MVQLCTADRKQGALCSPLRHLKQSQYGHSISLCILQCSVKTQCRLPPMFVTVLCTIDKSKALLSDIDNKASVLPALLGASIWNFSFNIRQDDLLWDLSLEGEREKNRIG